MKLTNDIHQWIAPIFRTSPYPMPNQYLDVGLLKQSIYTFLKQPLTDNQKENALFNYPIDVLEDLLKLIPD